ncbi:hypothetical protein [Methylotenera mobilis]|uniref:Uncharacterized protein n=1 Tax=Methylotenera mobilis (strain JLW8 / ATCC BAA-1282 / DSM 17540) TaxID=583345 RepID=C6WW82_METML|nr:hypothetical protein [Methylotenera mobilis]ACT48181.1 hypothetical protein Mmol_1275 [Methylotenera mobilis JLW8]
MDQVRILQQGHFDGFCLLYAIMNSFKSITESNASAEYFSYKYSTEWKNIISITPSIHEFANGNGSNFVNVNIKTELPLLDTFINTSFSILTKKNEKQKISAVRISRSEISSLDFKSSAVIFCTKEKAKTEHTEGLDHWLCIVGKKNNKYLLACSYTSHCINPCQYNEKLDRKTSRIYNNTINEEELNQIYKNAIYKIEFNY